MKITSAKVIVCSPGRNFVTLKIETEDGVYGLGDATVNGRELAVASYLTDHVIPLLVGKDARRIEDTWQYLYKGAYWRRGPVTMAAIGAVDTALWDILGKSTNRPVYQLLGGASRESVMVYGHANGTTLDDTVEAVGQVREARLPGRPRAVRDPGRLARVRRRARAARPVRTGRKGTRAETVWDTERYLDFAPSVFARLRQEFGADVHLLHDVHHRLTPIEAARLGKALEPYHLFWMEDPVPAELQEGFRLIRQHTTTPIAVGEVFNSIYDCHLLIEEQLIDYIRTAVVHAGGISHLRKIAALARAAPRPHRLPRRDRPQPGVHGGRAALRSQRSQLRHPGIDAAHGRDRSGLPARILVPRRHDAPRGGARAGRRHRRSARADVPVRAGVPADRTKDRWDSPQLVGVVCPRE